MMSQRDTISYLKDRVDELKDEVEMWKYDCKAVEAERDKLLVDREGLLEELDDAKDDVRYYRSMAASNNYDRE